MESWGQCLLTGGWLVPTLVNRCVELCPQVSSCGVLGFLGLLLAHWCMEPGSGPSAGQGHVLPQQVLRQPAYWAGLGPNINKLEGGFQNGSSQHQCPSGRMSCQKSSPCLLQGWTPFASCLYRRLSKINRWVSWRLLSNDCFCPGSWNMWDFVCTLLVWSLCFPQPSGSPQCKPY